MKYLGCDVTYMKYLSYMLHKKGIALLVSKCSTKNQNLKLYYFTVNRKNLNFEKLTLK